VLESWGRETLLVFHLTAHWRKPVDFNEQVLEQAAAQTESFRNVFRSPSEPAREDAWARLSSALEDDFNTPEALAVLHEWRDHDLLRRALDVFGLASLAERQDAPAEVVALAEARLAARERRSFDEADVLRERLAELGWDVRDTDGGFRLVPR
jgi:cysteinyl-tRNA synthetase